MHLFKSIYCDVDLATPDPGGNTRVDRGRGDSLAPPGGVGGRGGLHTGAWGDGALASDPGTRRSRRTGRNGRRRAARKPEKGDSRPGRRPLMSSPGSDTRPRERRAAGRLKQRRGDPPAEHPPLPSGPGQQAHGPRRVPGPAVSPGEGGHPNSVS